MTLKQVIDLVDGIEPNAYTNDVKTAWLNEVEGMVQTDVLLRAIDDIDQYTWTDDQQTTLLVKPPHDKLYRFYLQAMIQLANAEYDRYQNTMTVFNAVWGEFVRWFSRTIYPAGRDAVWRGYYLSAYGIAVAHGYSGTEAEWLASLKGEQSDPVELRYHDEALEWKYSSEETWNELLDLTALRTQVENDTIDDVNAAKSAAQSSATAAAGSATSASQSASAAQAALEEFTTPTASAETLSSGSPASASYSAGRFLFGIPRGGDGYSPHISVSNIPGGHRVTVTDAQGSQVFDVMDGEGSGDMTVSTYDPAGGARQVAFSDEIPTALSQLSGDSEHRTVTDTEKTAWNGKGSYSKPSAGIPKTDLASAVQTSLEKADSALQQHQSLAAYRTAAAQDTIDSNQNTVIDGKEAKGKITISGVEKTASSHTVTIVTNGVTTNLTLVGVS